MCIRDRAREAEHSVVEITGIHGNEGWIRENFDTVNSVSGVVIADTGVQLFILADNSIVEKSESFTAVSYTHLDVYKRQPLLIPVRVRCSLILQQKMAFQSLPSIPEVIIKIFRQ